MSVASKDSTRTFATALGGTAFLGLIAYGLSLFFNTPLAPMLYWSTEDALIGVAATVPLAVFLWWFMQSKISLIADFRQAQIEFFAAVGFEFTPFRIALMALFAGLFEELLFRGAIQTALTGALPLALAIGVSSILFGVVHWRTWLYALIATLIGVWLGVLFAITGNLLAPIITHALYDVIALVVTAKAITSWRADKIREEQSTVI